MRRAATAASPGAVDTVTASRRSAWYQILAGYVLGFIVASAVRSITMPLGVKAAHRVLMTAPTAGPEHAWPVFWGAMVLGLTIRSIAPLLAGLCVGWVAGRRQVFHGTMFGLAALIVLNYIPEPIIGETGPVPWQATVWPADDAMIVAGVLASALGGAIAALVQRKRDTRTAFSP